MTFLISAKWSFGAKTKYIGEGKRSEKKAKWRVGGIYEKRRKF